MASTNDSLPSSPSLPTTAGGDLDGDQEFSPSSHHHHHHHSLFLPSSSSSSYLDSHFHGLLPAASSSSMSMSPSHAPPPPHPPPPAPPSTKPPKKRPRASRRPPTTVLTTDTSNFRAMVQEFTGFPAPPFAAAPPPAVRPRLLAAGGVGGLPPFLMRPSPLKYTHSPAPPLPHHQSSTTASFLGNTGAAATSTSSLVDALALFAKSNVMAAPAPSTATAAASGSGGSDQYHHQHGHGMMGGLFNPFDDYEAAAAADQGDKVHGGAGGGHGRH